MSETEATKADRVLWLGDFMEFGQNLALALALTTFSGIAFFTEPVTGANDWHHKLAGFCIVAAILWAIGTGLRFVDGLAAHTKLRRKAWLNWTLGPMIVCFSCVLLGFSMRLPDNNHIVSICERFESRPDDLIHRSDECQRLYSQRRDYERRLRGEGK